jgi:hypothetical protein
MCRKASLCNNIYRSYDWGGNVDFWGSLDNLVLSHKLVIDRPKGSNHPDFRDSIYPLDYGFLEGTRARVRLISGQEC